MGRGGAFVQGSWPPGGSLIKSVQPSPTSPDTNSPFKYEYPSIDPTPDEVMKCDECRGKRIVARLDAEYYRPDRFERVQD